MTLSVIKIPISVIFAVKHFLSTKANVYKVIGGRFWWFMLTSVGFRKGCYIVNLVYLKALWRHKNVEI